MLKRFRTFLSESVFPVVKKPLVGMYDIAKNSLKDFFEGAPGPAFLKRAAMGVGSLLLFGALLAFFPMGLDMAGVVAMTLLQIPLGIYQKSFTKGLGKTFKKIKEQNSKPLKIGLGAGLVVLATVLAVSPVGRTFARRAVTSGLEKFAIPLLRIPMNRFKKQATRAVQNDEDTETVKELFSDKSEIRLSAEDAVSKKNDAVKSLKLMSPEQRRDFFDALNKDFPAEFAAAAQRQPPVDAAEQRPALRAVATPPQPRRAVG